MLLHIFQLIPFGLQPSLGPKDIGVLTEYRSLVLDSPYVGPDPRAAWDKCPSDMRPLGRGEFLRKSRHRGPRSDAFFDARLEVGEFLGFRAGNHRT